MEEHSNSSLLRNNKQLPTKALLLNLSRGAWMAPHTAEDALGDPWGMLDMQLTKQHQ